MESATLLQILFCDLLYVIAFLSLFKVIQGAKTPKMGVLICTICLLLICLFNYISGDYYHYLELFDLHKAGILLNSNIEQKYLDLIDSAPSYEVFRLIIWGVAIVFVMFTFKLTKIEFGVALFLFVIRNFIAFSYARVSLAMAIAFLGLALLSKLWDRKIIWAIIGVYLIYVSIYYHKTAIFGVFVCIASLLIIRQSRITLILAVLLIPVIALVLRSSVMDFYMDFDLSDSELMLDKGQKYVESSSSGLRYNSLTKNITDILWRAPYYLVLLMYAKITREDQFNNLPIPIRLFTNAAVVSIVVAILFIFNNFTLYYRFINFAMIPSIVFVTYCHTYQIYPKLVKAFYILSVIGVSISLLYKTILSLL